MMDNLVNHPVLATVLSHYNTVEGKTVVSYQIDRVVRIVIIYI